MIVCCEMEITQQKHNLVCSYSYRNEVILKKKQYIQRNFCDILYFTKVNLKVLFPKLNIGYNTQLIKGSIIFLYVK